MTCDALREPVRGVGRVCETLLPKLSSDATPVTPLDVADNRRASELAGHECAVIPAPIGPAKTARWHATLLRRIARAGIEHDVLLSMSGFPLVFGDHERACMWIHDLHMLEPGFYQPGKRIWFQAFLRRSLQKSALRICVSEFTKRELERRFPELDPAHNVVVHNAVPTNFTPETAAIDGGRRGHFLFVGQLERRKNLSRLLVAWSAARAAGVEGELRIVGRRGPGAEAILEQAAALDSVHVHTNADDRELHELYSGAKAVLLPSLHEGFGIPAIEAMQAGKPVLTSKGTALEEVTADAALLVEPTSTTAIRDGILALDRNAELRGELVARGHERASRFTPDAQATALRDALTERFRI